MFFAFPMILNLTLFFLDGSGDGPAVISDAMVTLKGHKSRITDMCWSPHLPPAKLLTVSYDGRAIVSHNR